MTTSPIDFWFSIGSTYTFLSVMRLAELAKKEDVSFRWRPFSVRVLMTEQNNFPFRGKPIKTAYMWRDIERRAATYGLPARLPAPYPLTEFDLVNRIAVLADKEGWCRDFVCQAYRRWFQLGEEIGVGNSLDNALRDVGQDPHRVIAKSGTDAIVLAYREATDEARRLNLFGSPTFMVGNEVFWGDDRLDDAIRWAKRGSGP